MRVLFVDDEPRVLEAIERLFFDLDVDWEALFASTAARALELVASERIDVIVCDMRLPGQDSATLLNQVCNADPRIVRIVLSGQTDEASALRVLPVAHQFLAKPCDPATLRRVIENTRALRLLLDDAQLENLIGQIGHLPSPPRLYTELSRMLKDESADVSRAVAVIEQDPAMVSKLLQVANSSLFAGGAGVSDIKTAVLRLGLRAIRQLALGVGAFEASRGAERALGVSVDDLQRRSLTVAKVAAKISEKPVDADSAFMAGLMYDLGQLLLATVAPERFVQARERAAASQIPLHVAERQLWGVTHAEVGAFLLGLWGLPYPIIEAVANHHAPERNAHEACGLPQVVWLSAELVEGREPAPELIERFRMQGALGRARAFMERLGP
jgi:HD-like signal output (HDOD) protein/ActR/RegA family two-component response regulator